MCAIAGEYEPGYEDGSYQGQREDDGTQIKDGTKVGHEFPEFSEDVGVNSVEDSEVKPETEMLPVYTEGQLVSSHLHLHLSEV